MDTDQTMNSELIDSDLSGTIIGCCMEVSNELGNGFLEKVYENSLAIALQSKNIRVRSQVPFPVEFRNIIVGEYFCDLLVEDRIILEVKAVKLLAREHEAQLLNYLAASKLKLGLLVNFGKPKLEWKRFVL